MSASGAAIAPPSRELKRTRHPGIYRRGDRYVVRVRPGGVGRVVTISARTLAEAREIQTRARLDADFVRRRSEQRAKGQTLREYSVWWLATYQGRTAHGFLESSRKEYGADLRLHCLPTLGDMPLIDITARDIRHLIRVLEGAGLKGTSIRRALAPLKALLATAAEEGDIPANPAAGVQIRSAQKPEPVRALNDPELGRLLEELQGYDRFVVEFLASTGLRFSEALGLCWDKVDLEGRRSSILVRRRDNDLGPTKTRNSTRIVPISARTARGLAELRAERGGADTDLVFRTLTGTPLKANNFFNRAFKPAARRAGVEWANIKTLRHTCTTRLLRRGATAAQVSRWLGHASVAFTMETYVHLDADDLPDPSILDPRG